MKRLINKHISHVFYLEFTIKVFQMYFLISVNEVIFTIIYTTYVAIYFICTIFGVTNIFGARSMEVLKEKDKKLLKAAVFRQLVFSTSKS